MQKVVYFNKTRYFQLDHQALDMLLSKEQANGWRVYQLLPHSSFWHSGVYAYTILFERV